MSHHMLNWEESGEQRNIFENRGKKHFKKIFTSVTHPITNNCFWKTRNKLKKNKTNCSRHMPWHAWLSLLDAGQSRGSVLRIIQLLKWKKSNLMTEIILSPTWWSKSKSLTQVNTDASRKPATPAITNTRTISVGSEDAWNEHIVKANKVHRQQKQTWMKSYFS